MIYRQLLITFLLPGLIISVYAAQGEAELDEQNHTSTVIEAAQEKLSTEGVENTIEGMILDPQNTVTTYPETEIETSTPSSVSNSILIKDVIVVLDNSGSMKKNDPQFLTKHAVTEFINSLDEFTRVSIVIFDQDVRTAVPLTEISSSSRQGLLNSLSQINYKGLYTNSPAAIESAIYGLKNNAREDARKLIVFMTDGIVDTGNADRDIEKTKWLKEDLAADAADAGIKIFGIAFTENADFELIQSLAQNTDGEYYRALLADDLQEVFSKLITLINKPDEPEVIREPEIKIIEKIVERMVEPAQTTEPVIINVPAEQLQFADESERKRSMLILVALVVLVLAVIAIILMLLRGNKSKSPDKEIALEAYLNDIHGVTEHAKFALGSKPTMLGRVVSKDKEHLNYFVVPETTIGRRHSLIEYKDFSYWIIDQGSINGTFVNDKKVTTEVRLRHGDIIRLHKVVFEFVMPELDDSGMTVISNTVIANSGMPGLKTAEAVQDDIDLSEPDFAIGTVDTGSGYPVDEDDEDDEETIMRGNVLADDDSEASDEIIMLDESDAEDIMEDYLDESDAEEDIMEGYLDESDAEDIMEGYLDESDAEDIMEDYLDENDAEEDIMEGYDGDDATIRPG